MVDTLVGVSVIRRPGRRLEIALVPADPDAMPDVAALRAVGERFGARLDVSPAVRFWSPGQGGFRATCPRSGAVVTAAFGAGVESWRGGGPRTMHCPCGAEHALEEAVLRPEGAFGRVAVVIPDAAGPDPDSALVAAVEAVAGPLRVVRRRP